MKNFKSYVLRFGSLLHGGDEPGGVELYDGSEVLCQEPSIPFSYRDSHGVLQILKMKRCVDNKRDVNTGIWIEDAYLIPLESDDEDTFEKSVFEKEITFSLKRHSLNLVQFNDKIQCSVIRVNDVTAIKDNEVLYSEYKKRSSFGSVKWEMENCNSDEQIEDLLARLRNIE